MRETKKHYYAYRSFWPELEARKRFREQVGVTVNNVMISNTANSLGFPYTKYPPVWKWNGVYDLDAFDKQLDDVLSVVPDAKFILLLDLNTPHWWTRYLGAFGVRYDSYYELGKISGCEIWRRDTAEYMKTVMKHAQEKYGDRIEAYVLGAGGATEWHDRSRSEESVYKLAAFRRWQKAHGKEMTDIPGRIRRDSGSYDMCSDFKDVMSYYNGNDPTGGAYEEIFHNQYALFRSPEKDQDVIDYLQFCAEFNVDTIGFFMKEARTVIPENVELGCFFGYYFMPWTVAACHLAYEKLLSNPDIDFVTAPMINHELGCGSVSATVHDTIVLKGKRMMQEYDQKVWCYNRVMSDCCTLPAPTDAVEDVSWDKPESSEEMSKKFTYGSGNGLNSPHRVAEAFKRDSSMALINGDSVWWFDMWGGFYQHEEVLEALHVSHEIYKQEIDKPNKPNADVLVVEDPENLLLVNDMNERSGTFHSLPVAALGKAGVSYEICSFNDLEKLDMERFRFVILCHPFRLPERKMEVLKKYVLNSNRTVLWMYGTVIDKDGKWNEANVEKVCGIPYAASGIPRKNMGSWNSAYIFRVDKEVSTETMRQLAEEAHCHIWCDQLRPVWTSERLFCVHTAWQETLKVNFPRKMKTVTELYTGQVWHDTDSLTLETDGVKSYLFRME